MSCIYIVVYNTPKFNRFTKKTSKDKTISEFLQKLQNHKFWHYDIGDDPSFYQFFKRKSLTWGICRTNIRNNLQNDDVVLFYCFCADCFAYFLTGFATVDKKIKQSEIWKKNEYSSYRDYFNLLIKPSGSGKKWIHFERLAEITGEHSDWLNRLILSKEPESSFVLNNDTIQASYFENNNYVIFKHDLADTYMLEKQIKVATWKPKSKKETWIESEIVSKIHAFTFELSNFDKYKVISKKNRSSLRVHDRNQSHVYIKYDLKIEGLDQWKKDFKEYLEKVNENLNNNP